MIVKIHPSTSVLAEYQSIINPIDPSIRVYQHGSIEEFLDNADLMISFQSSTAEVYALLTRKPVIICNYFNLQKDAFLERELAIECKDSSHLLESIHKALENPPSEQKREAFIKEFMYMGDGRATERICDTIMNLIKNKHDTKNKLD